MRTRSAASLGANLQLARALCLERTGPISVSDWRTWRKLWRYSLKGKAWYNKHDARILPAMGDNMAALIEVCARLEDAALELVLTP